MVSKDDEVVPLAVVAAGAGDGVNGIDVANFEFAIACLFTGNSPVARKPDLICAGLNVFPHNLFSKPVV